MGQTKRSLASLTIGIAARTGFGNVTDGVGAAITVKFSVGRSTNSDGIHHKDQGAHVEASVVSIRRAAADATPVRAQ
jgi:hypothetical protein